MSGYIAIPNCPRKMLIVMSTAHFRSAPPVLRREILGSPITSPNDCASFLVSPRLYNRAQNQGDARVDQIGSSEVLN